MGVGNQNGIAEFYYTTNHVKNTFLISNASNIVRKEYVPILKLDEIINSLKDKNNNIFLLNIDVEGLDYDVLLSGAKTLSEINIICIEANNDTDKKRITDYLLKNNFRFEIEIKCNLLFINKSLEL